MVEMLKHNQTIGTYFEKEKTGLMEGKMWEWRERKESVMILIQVSSMSNCMDGVPLTATRWEAGLAMAGAEAIGLLETC